MCYTRNAVMQSKSKNRMETVMINEKTDKMKGKEKWTMLLVDDMEINIAILENIFQGDFIIKKADGGRQALDILNNTKIDMVILDIVMPEINGFDVLRTMKADERLAAIPVVIATSDVEGNEEKALNLGADDFITKPYNPSIVYKRVENILEKHILERQKLQSALQESKAEYQSLADSVPGGISTWRVTDRLDVLYFNDGLCELLGCTREEFLECYLEDLSRVIYEEDRQYVMETLLNGNTQGDRVNMAHRIVRKDGQVRWVKLSAIHYKTDDGAPVYCAVDMDITESREYEILIEKHNQDLQHMLEYDALTDVYNRYGFCSRTAKFLKERSGESFVLTKIDIEQFKVINELYGVETGDRILKMIAGGLQQFVNQNGVLGRLEADHFVLCIPDDSGYISDLKHFLQDRVAEAGIPSQIRLFYGIYPINDRRTSVELMCDRCDLALKSVKGNYNRNYAVYDEKMHERVLLEQEMSNDMEQALEEGQFQVYYQPVYNLETERIASAEALVRWFHPKKGLISPGAFIPFFEKNGFIVKFDAYIREQVAKDLREMAMRGKRQIPISVNISRLELYVPDFAKNLIQLLEQYRIPCSFMRLEITESAYTDNPIQLVQEVSYLQKAGFQILMDDFGSGYSSLNMLKEMPVDILKLDMKFLSGEDFYGRESNILSYIIQMTQSMGMTTVAEGIETEAQAEFLKQLSCKYGQGYYYARPMPKEDFIGNLEEEEHVN